MNALDQAPRYAPLAFAQTHHRGPVHANVIRELGRFDLLGFKVLGEGHGHIVPIGHVAVKPKSAYWARASLSRRWHNRMMAKDSSKSPPHFLREWREHRQLTQDDIAAKANIGRSAVSKIEAGKKPLMEHHLAGFARGLGVSIPQLYQAPPAGSAVVDIHRNANTEGSVASNDKGNVTFLSGSRSTGLRDLPIRGHTKAGVDGVFLDQGETWGFAMRPESLRGVEEAYAVRVYDDCMMPRYKPGTVLQVDPFRRPNPEDNVVIQLTNGQCYVKELVRRAGGALVCKQYNPPKNVEYKLDKVKSVHLVVGVDYLER